MLSREEKKQLNTVFWEDFRKHMGSSRSSSGKRINWLHYPTDVKDVYLRMEVDGKGARLCLDIQPKDDGIRQIIWEQMNELKKVLEDTMNYPTEWTEDHISANGIRVSRISWDLKGVSFYSSEDRPQIFEFLKNRILEFDEFYQEFKEILILLTD